MIQPMCMVSIRRAAQPADSIAFHKEIRQVVPFHDRLIARPAHPGTTRANVYFGNSGMGRALVALISSIDRSAVTLWIFTSEISD